ncbi:hypothetical protein K439DRAFT_1616827 [Ramaria rubella]|nr:hypothetical protein K439DRAFT_1616827 [Ramaria rubella]
MHMTARQSLAALPGGTILYVTPKMQEHCIPENDYRLWSTRSAYVTDGAELMTCKAHTTFVSRLLLWLCQHTLRGMPHHVKIDLNIFLSSISYEDENRNTNTIEPWQFGELINNLSQEQQEEYANTWDTVDHHTNVTSQHKEAHMCDCTFLNLSVHKGPTFEEQFHQPSHYEGFNDDSDEEEETFNIFDDGNTSNNQANTGEKRKPKKKGKKKAKKKRKGDNGGTIHVDYESDIDMDAVIYTSSRK